MLQQGIQMSSDIVMSILIHVLQEKAVKQIGDKPKKANEDKGFRIHHLVKLLGLNKAVCRVHANGLLKWFLATNPD